jgi:hypothetical protein
MTTLGLPLSIMVPCRPSPGARSVPHSVIIGSDWSVFTGHDEGLERIAAAFGGGVSCLPMLTATIPALRLWHERATRAAGLLVRSDDWGATWASTSGARTCCPAAGFADPAEAAAHVRSPRHVATEVDAPRRELGRLVAGFGARADPGLPTHLGLGPLGTDAVAEAAWACGLAPDWVADVRGRLAASGVVEVELEVLLAIAQTGADPSWVAGTVTQIQSAHAHAPPESVLHWIAWTVTDLDRAAPTVRAQWAARGVRRADILALSEAGYRPAAAHEVAHGWGISVPGAAQLLARWVTAGFRPTPEQLTRVRDVGLGFPPPPPGRAAVDRIAGEVARRIRAGWALPPGTDTSATGLAIELVRRGTVHDTVAAVLGLVDVGPPA